VNPVTVKGDQDQCRGLHGISTSPRIEGIIPDMDANAVAAEYRICVPEAEKTYVAMAGEDSSPSRSTCHRRIPPNLRNIRTPLNQPNLAVWAGRNVANVA